MSDTNRSAAQQPIINGQSNAGDGRNVEKTKAAPDLHQTETHKSDTPKEIGGPKGLEPTRYGDWESKGRCYDF